VNWDYWLPRAVSFLVLGLVLIQVARALL